MAIIKFKQRGGERNEGETSERDYCLPKDLYCQRDGSFPLYPSRKEE